MRKEYFICVCGVIFLLIESSVATNGAITAPPELCTSQWNNASQTRHVMCFVHGNETLYFRDIREWMENFVNITVHISVVCESGGAISIRKPIKGKYLTKLLIMSCKIYRMYDYDFTEVIRDMPLTLKTMEIVDCQIIITTKELWENYEKHKQHLIRKFYPCFITPSLERYIERNVSVKLRGKITFGRKEFQRITTENYALRPQCLYRNLLYYEKSFSTNGNTFIRHFLEKAQQFPKLHTLNFTHLKLTKIPCKLYEHGWSAFFPKLHVIDLSHNDLNDVPFKFPSHDQNMTLYVKMTKNNVTVLDQKLLSNLQSFSPGFVNLYDNPLVCDCRMKNTVKILHGTEKHLYFNLENLKCQYPPINDGRRIKELDAEALCKIASTENENPINNVMAVSLVVLTVCFIVTLIVIRFKEKLKTIAFKKLNVKTESCVPDTIEERGQFISKC